MYRELDCQGICDLMGIAPDDAPDGLILHGLYDMPCAVQRWRDRLADARVPRQVFNVAIGEHRGLTLWYAPVLGAPMAAFVVHSAAALGARGIIQVGSFGGTRRGMAVGDLLLVTGAGRGDGASDWYLPKEAPARADPALTAHLRATLRERGLPWQEGSVYTTPAFLAERWEDVLRWEAGGYAGVEMEAATTFAIAAHFRVPSACLLYLLDNLIEERHLLHNTDEERLLVRAHRDLVQEIALDALTTWVSAARE